MRHGEHSSESNGFAEESQKLKLCTDVQSVASTPSPTPQDQGDRLMSPAASSIMGGLAADMQARILALQSARLHRTPSTASHISHTAKRPQAARTFSGSTDASSHIPSDSQSASTTPRESPNTMSGHWAVGATGDISDAFTLDSKMSLATLRDRESEGTDEPVTDISSDSGRSRSHSRERVIFAPTELGAMPVIAPASEGPGGLGTASAGPVPTASRAMPPMAAAALQKAHLKRSNSSKLKMRRPAGLSLTEARGPNPRNGPGGFRASGPSSAPVEPVKNQLVAYQKYFDIETGSLNFAGKAAVHSQGIDFSSGTSFRISLDELEPLEELGAGNYGTVTRAVHKPTGVEMALKEIRLELDEANFRQILMELDVLHRCHSPHMVDFYGAFFVEGAVYLCIEYMDGGSVNQIYQDGIPEDCLAYVTYQVVHGLQDLKEQHKIIHRDVKPTNILASTSGKIKLCDFGVSGNLVASIARTNIGCQSYMAPERINSAGGPQAMAYSAESDIWSLGLSIIEMANGSYPYPVDMYNSVFSQLTAIVDGKPPQLDPKKFSPEACSFVENCLNKNPRARPNYAKLLQHPWLANRDWSLVDMGKFVRERRALRTAPEKTAGPS